MAVNLNKPLLRGKWLMLDNQKHWISCNYERLQNICFKCGILSHKGRRCSKQKGESPEDDLSCEQFGPWIQAQPMNSTIFDFRKYGGSNSSKQQQGRHKEEMSGVVGGEAKDGKGCTREDSQASFKKLEVRRLLSCPVR